MIHRQSPAASRQPPKSLSVIVPTLNEERVIGGTLEDLRRRGVEDLVVVDGGSSDRTAEIAGPLARFLVEQGGLARQLNRGARESVGEVLLFHFADLRLPESGLDDALRAMARSGTAGGAFRLGFDSPRAVYRWIARGANLRNRLGFGPFGDQAIFARREAFERVGGFTPGAPLEDFDLVRKLRRVGRFVLLPSPVLSSVRRWEEDGVLHTALCHWGVSVLYLLGLGGRAATLKRWLQTRRGGGSQGRKSSVKLR